VPSLTLEKKQQKLPKISIVPVLTKWVTNGCLAKVMMSMEKEKAMKEMADITIITKKFEQ